MTRDGEPEPLQDAIRTNHPGIADEIQGAIDTLRKIHQIAVTVTPGVPAGAGGGLAPADATLVGSSLLPASQEAAGTELMDSSAAGPGASRELPTLAGGDSRGQSRIVGTELMDSSAAGPGIRRDPPTLAACQSFGRYQIARLLGRGAMGAVYLAYDSQLQRYVALKTPFLGEDPQTIARFYREARAAAQIRSPYVCPIYDVGHIGGIYYLSMAFIDGKPLERIMADGRPGEVASITDLAKKIARGLQKSHEQNVIHRDLKPANIMIDADGEPIVMDFGLARKVDDEILITAPGKILGTPAYMSPEQVEGDASKIGPATDIYSLGVILYQMLTGRLPFQGSLLSILRQIGTETPPRPSEITPGLGADSQLERICLTMMAKSPADRYSSMADLVEALEESPSREGTPVARKSAWNRLWSKSIRLFSTPTPDPARRAP